MIVSITDDNMMAALRSFLLSVLPDGIEVVQGQDNNVPEPPGKDFVVMWPILRSRLSTNQSTFNDATQQTDVMAPTQATVQIDVHGPSSADNAQIITTLFRNEFGYDSFVASGFDIAPLYCGDAKQSPFVNGESQFETRYIIDAVMQINPVVTMPQQSANQLSVDLRNVDAEHPP